MPAWVASRRCTEHRLSTTGSSSLGTALVAGRNRVASPAAGMTALTARVRPVAAAVEGFAECSDMSRDYRPRLCRGG
jgi:hypothetical protein